MYSTKRKIYGNSLMCYGNSFYVQSHRHYVVVVLGHFSCWRVPQLTYSVARSGTNEVLYRQLWDRESRLASSSN